MVWNEEHRKHLLAMALQCSWNHVISFIQPLSAEVMNLAPPLILEPFEDALSHLVMILPPVINFTCYYPSYIGVSYLTLL